MAELEQELQATREYLQTTIEELETTNEEFKSSNEELQSTNEELQSTNEELETSKEEQQSVNEELATVNAELQSKVDQLSRTRNDMQNLLASTEVATIFLDMELRIQRFTPVITELINLIDSDVGRPISHIASNLEYGELTQDAQQVLDDLAPREREARSRDGRWYAVRMGPYRTTENLIDGLVITFVDISEQKRVQDELGRSEAMWRSMVDTVREPLIVMDGDLKVRAANRSFYEGFGATAGETEGQRLYDLGNGQWDIPELRRLLEEILPRDSSFDDFEVEHEFPGLGKRRMLLNARRVQGSAGDQGAILLAIEDVTGERHGG